MSRPCEFKIVSNCGIKENQSCVWASKGFQQEKNSSLRYYLQGSEHHTLNSPDHTLSSRAQSCHESIVESRENHINDIVTNFSYLHHHERFSSNKNEG